MAACLNLLSVQVEHSHVVLLFKTSQALLPNTHIGSSSTAHEKSTRM